MKGRGGATIREITKASRARVDVHRNYESEKGGANSGQQNQPQQQQNVMTALNTASNSEKVISIFGKEGESISTACKKILEVSDGYQGYLFSQSKGWGGGAGTEEKMKFLRFYRSWT